MLLTYLLTLLLPETDTGNIMQIENYRLKEMTLQRTSAFWESKRENLWFSLTSKKKKKMLFQDESKTFQIPIQQNFYFFADILSVRGSSWHGQHPAPLNMNKPSSAETQAKPNSARRHHSRTGQEAPGALTTKHK